MNWARVQETLEGFNGPLYTENIDLLNNTFASLNCCGSPLEEAGKKVEGFIKLGYYFTYNWEIKIRYYWFWGLEFELENTVVAVLFPCAHLDKTGGIQLDRSIALYVKEPISNSSLCFLTALLSVQLVNAFLDQRIKELILR